MTLLLTACGGGGGGGSDDLPSTRPEGSADGKAQHGPIRNANISAYSWNGSQGQFLASTTSDDEGRYSLELGTESSNILVQSQGGDYTEEANTRSVSMDANGLKAVVYYEEGRTVNVQLTYFTHLAACRAEYLVGTGINASNAIVQANNEFSAIIGESITGVEPVDTTKAEAFTPFMTPAHRYGIAVAAVSLAVDSIRQRDGADNSTDTYTVKYFTNIGCSDILADGVLDGIAESTPGNPSGQLYLGNTAITTETYRKLLARSVIDFGDHENNRTGLVASDLLEMANSVSLSASALFGGAAGEPVDNQPPMIVATTAEGTLLAGTTEIVFDVQDPLGVSSIEFYVDGVFFASAQPNDPTMLINTTLFGDGDHEVSVVASDVLGNTSEPVAFTYNFVNTGASVSITSAALVNSTDYMASGSFVGNGAGVDRIEVNGVVAILDTNAQTWTADVELVGGQDTVQAVIFDSLGNSTTEELVVNIDVFSPTINSWSMTARFTNYDGLWNRCELGSISESTSNTRPVCLNAERISLNGTAVSASLTNDDYIVLAVDFSDPQGQGTFSDNADIVIDYQVLLNDEITKDWSVLSRPEPEFRFAYLPVTTEFFGENFYQVSRDDTFKVNVRATDKTGNYHTVDFNFSLDLLMPAVAVTTDIDERLFGNPYANRSNLNGADVEVAYTYDNSSSMPYLIYLDPSNNHLLTQSYESAQRFNLVRTRTDWEWRVKWERELNNWVTVTQLYYESCNGSTFTKITPPNSIIGAYRSINSDWESPPQPSTWNSQFSKYPCIDDFGGNNWNLHETSSDRSRAAHYASTDEDDNFEYRRFNFDERKVYTTEVAAGYPRNELQSYTTTYTVTDTAVRVVDETHGVEIIPRNGWYRIPPNTIVKIIRTVELPFATNYTDQRVALDDSTVPYTSVIYQDTQLTWKIDTHLDITRAINPGSIDEVDSVSQTVSTEGLGIKTYTMSR